MFGRDSGSGRSAGGANNNAGFGAGMPSGQQPVEIDPRARPDGTINSQRSNNLIGSTGVSSGDHHNYQPNHQQPHHYTKGLTDQQLHEQQQLIQQQLLQQQQHKLQQVGVIKHGHIRQGGEYNVD